jgi:hypothetical protein
MSLHQIKVSREEVLKIVKENKEKHDNILKGAIEGYWLDAESYLKKYEKEEVERINKNHRDQLKKMRKERKAALKLLKERIKSDMGVVKAKDRTKGFCFWRQPYPEDHGDDYLGTIRRLELCVEGEVELDSNEFDSYIRNKWTWKDSFINSNRGYVTSYYCGTGSYALNAGYAVTSSWACQSISGSWASSSLSSLISF